MALLDKYFLPIILFFTVVTLSCNKNNSGPLEANFKCIDGLAQDTYPCNNIDLYAQISPTELGGIQSNDIWGWTDPQTNKEYALVGMTDGVSFVDVSDPNNPVVVGYLPESRLSTTKLKVNPDPFDACAIGIGDTDRAKSLQQGSTWRDIKVYENHAFVVKDYSNSSREPHGMQVFDLTKLRNFEDEAIVFSEDLLYTDIGNAHNIVINEQTGFAYAVGVREAEVCSTSGLHMIDIRDPKNPTYAGCYEDPTPPRRFSNSAYIHDAQCVVYDGPDIDYRGKELCFNSAERSIVISDVTDKENPVTIGFNGETEMQYSHQGWLTENHSYFLMNDELDEAGLGRDTKTYIWDISDLENPEFVGHYSHNTVSIDHNLYIKDNIVYQTNYNAGLQVLKLGDLSKAELSPIAFFDTKPGIETSNVNGAGFSGAWSNYPYFESGIIIVSDIEDGLFILRPDF